VKSLNKKDIFTQTLVEKAPLAKKSVDSITNQNIIDGHGPIIKFENNTFGYDLRLPSSKGALPLNHPILVASKLEDIASDKDFKNHPIFEDLAVRVIKNDPSHHLEDIWYTNKEALFDSMPSKTKLLPWSREFSLAIANTEKSLDSFKEVKEAPGLYDFLEFYFHIALNKGKGRIADIEDQLVSEGVQAKGLYIRVSKKVSKENFLQQGLFVDNLNFKSDHTLLCLPISIFDYQVIDIANRVKKLEDL
tara:strand:+ start:29817 stop:30560 length:744 start_codon:yes stop_codon:yes gene_type:complete